MPIVDLSSIVVSSPLVGVVGAGDPGSSRLVYAMVIGLVVAGIGLVLLAIWILRQTRPDLDVLAPLERMGDGDWKKRDPSTQRRMLDEVRPAGAEPLAAEPPPPPIDSDFEQADHAVTSFSDLGPGLGGASSDTASAEPDAIGSGVGSDDPEDDPQERPEGESVDGPESGPAGESADGAELDPADDPVDEPVDEPAAESTEESDEGPTGSAVDSADGQHDASADTSLDDPSTDPREVTAGLGGRRRPRLSLPAIGLSPQLAQRPMSADLWPWLARRSARRVGVETAKGTLCRIDQKRSWCPSTCPNSQRKRSTRR